MINPNHILQFCNTLKAQYGAGFMQQPTPTGMKVIGEYCTYSGQVLSLILDIYANQVQLKVFDAARRLIFSEKTAGNINSNANVITFFQKSMTSY